MLQSTLCYVFRLLTLHLNDSVPRFKTNNEDCNDELAESGAVIKAAIVTKTLRPHEANTNSFTPGNTALIPIKLIRVI